MHRVSLPQNEAQVVAKDEACGLPQQGPQQRTFPEHAAVR